MATELGHTESNITVDNPTNEKLAGENCATPARLALIVAMGRDGAIGRDNQLLWHLRGDLPRFKSLTSGHTVIMGRKTWESLPKRPLPGRLNIVITHNKDFNEPGAVVASSPEEALKLAAQLAPDDDMPFVIGGGNIYRQLLPSVTHLYLTLVDVDTPDADTFLPADLHNGFIKVAETPGEGEIPFKFIDYVKPDCIK